VVVHGQCFSCTLALIVAAPDTCCLEKHIYTSVKLLWRNYTFYSLLHGLQGALQKSDLGVNVLAEN